MKLLSWDAQRDGALSESSLAKKIEALGYSVTRYTYPPGTRFPPHTHAGDKADGVLSGRFRITLEGRSVVLEPGDIVFVPRDSQHAAEVVGDEPVVSLDGIKR